MPSRSRERSALWTPAPFGAIPIFTSTGFRSGSETSDALENVPFSLPDHFNRNFIGPEGPVVRVSTTVRSPFIPECQPSRSKIPGPESGGESHFETTVRTGARLSITIRSRSEASSVSRFQAGATWMRPLPCL